MDENERTRVQVWFCLPMRNRRLTAVNCRGNVQSAMPSPKRVQMLSLDSGIDRKHVEEIAEEYKDTQRQDSS